MSISTLILLIVATLLFNALRNIQCGRPSLVQEILQPMIDQVTNLVMKPEPQPLGLAVALNEVKADRKARRLDRALLMEQLNDKIDTNDYGYHSFMTRTATHRFVTEEDGTRRLVKVAA